MLGEPQQQKQQRQQQKQEQKQQKQHQQKQDNNQNKNNKNNKNIKNNKKNIGTTKHPNKATTTDPKATKTSELTNSRTPKSAAPKHRKRRRIRSPLNTGNTKTPTGRIRSPHPPQNGSFLWLSKLIQNW